MRKDVISEMSRDRVVASMSKKLANTKGVNAANRSRKIRTTLIINALIGSALVLLICILFTNKNRRC